MLIGDKPESEHDCHWCSALEEFIGVRAIIKTTKGTCRGRVHYLDGWYYCRSPQRLVNGEWVVSSYTFYFRKSQFRKAIRVPSEDSSGM